ncbi:MAG: DNA repair protein RadC [Methanoregulaceae archaeon]|nr:DNA repair protein RadC [Methanoregulaceae archaeon]
MKKMKELAHCDRPRERIARMGPQALSDQELLAAIIGRGTRGRDVFSLAADISKKLSEGSSGDLYEKVLGINGMGPVRAAQIAACFEISRRYNPGNNNGSLKVTEPGHVLPLVEEIRGKKQEYFVCVTLNGAGEVLATRTVTVGLLNHSLVHPREVFADAITDRAASIICVHNHPSGSLEPSSQDITITKQLIDSGTILGIRVLDHVIVTRQGYLSMREQGLI